MFKFREHRGALADSLETTVLLKDRDELVAHCQHLVRSFGFDFPASALMIKTYSERPAGQQNWMEEDLHRQH